MSTVIDAIRQKYPEYAQVPDGELTLRIGSKYPQYLDQDPVFKSEYQGHVAAQGMNAAQDVAGTAQRLTGIGMASWTPPTPPPMPAYFPHPEYGGMTLPTDAEARGAAQGLAIPGQLLTQALKPLGFGVSTVLNAPKFDPMTEAAGGQATAETGKTLTPLPHFALSPGEETAAKVMGFPYNLLPAMGGTLDLAARNVEGFTQPEQLPLLAGGAIPKVGKAAFGLMGLSQLAGLPQEVQQASETLQRPDATTGEKIAAVGQPLVSGAMGLGMVHGGMPEAGVEAPPSPLNKPFAKAPELSPAELNSAIRDLAAQLQKNQVVPAAAPEPAPVAATPPAPVVPPTPPTPLRAQVEGESDVLHAMNNAGFAAKGKGTLAEVKPQLTAIYDAFQQTGDKAAALAAIDALKSPPTQAKPTETPAIPIQQTASISSGAEESPGFAPQGLTESTGDYYRRIGRPMVPPTMEGPMTELAAREKELRGDFASGAVRFLVTPKESGFPDLNAKVDATQVWNRLRNKLPGEAEVLEATGVADKVKAMGKVAPLEAARIVQEGAPRVEVRKLEAKPKDPALTKLKQQEHAFVDRQIEIEHQLDTIKSGWRNGVEMSETGATELPKYRERWGQGPDVAALIKEYNDLQDKRLQNDPQLLTREIKELHPNESATARYTMVNPKPLDQMPGAVDLLVRVPMKGKDFEALSEESNVINLSRKAIEKTNQEAGLKYESSHYPTEGKNLLAHVRGYMETLPDGKKVFHVFEVQSDWAQAALKYKEETERQAKEMSPQEKEKWRMERAATPEVSNDPLLRHYERLALKAAIDHAKKEGASAIAISDAETAMLSEGHDRAAAYTSGEEGSRPTEKDISQAAGMRLHYDQTLPKIVEELTGQKGERVEFGEHQNVRLKPQEYDGAGGLVNTGEGMRKDLIFRNPDGTPKTSITARSYDLSKVPDTRFSLFERDKAATRPGYAFSPPGGVQSLYQTLPEHEVPVAKALGLGKVDNMGDAMRSLGASKDAAVPETWKGLARFLDERFGSVLRTVKVGLDDGGMGGAHYNVGENKAYLDLEGNRPFHLGQTALEEAAHAATYWQFQYPKNSIEFKAAELIRSLRKTGGEKNLSPEESRFMRDQFGPMMEQRMKDGTLPQDFWNRVDKANVLRSRVETLYRLNDDQEFIAGMFSDPRFRRFLNSFDYGDRNGLFKFVDAVKSLLGVGKDKALDTAFDALINVSEAEGLGGDRAGQGRMFAPASSGQSWNRGWMRPDSKIELHESTTTHEESAIKNYKLTEPEAKEKGYVRLVLLRGDKTLFADGRPTTKQLSELKNFAIENGVDLVDGKGRMLLEVVNRDKLYTPPIAAVPALRDYTAKETVKAIAGYLSGWSLPRHAAINEDLANAGVTYGSSQLINQYVPRSMVSQVLTGRADLNFRRTLGAVLAQGQFEGLRKYLESQGETAKAAKVRNVWDDPGSPIRDEAEFQRVKNHPDTQAAITRHMGLVQPLAEQYHSELGGKLRAGDPETGAFINMKALTGKEPDPSSLYVDRQGSALTGLQRKSRFNREFKGTAENYEYDYRVLAERMLKSNSEQAFLKRYTDAMVEHKMAAETPQPGWQPHEIVIRGGAPGQLVVKKLWVNPKIDSEFQGLRRLDGNAAKGGVGYLMGALNDLQVFGLTDALFHTKNQVAALATSLGGGPIMYDAARKAIPPIGVVDGIARTLYHGVRVLMDSPEVQQEMATIANAGAARGNRVHLGVLGKGAKALGLSEKIDPNYWTSKAINLLDQGGRISLNRMYDSLVERGWAKDSPLDRREFINRMGQYNSRLMSRGTKALRESAIAPFAVAGLNFNRQAVMNLTASPMVRAANPAAWYKMRLMNALTMATAFAVVPGLINYMRTGSPFGRAGVKPGQIDLGTDDKYGKPNVYDPQALNLVRRGMNITGLTALDRAGHKKLSTKDTTEEAVRDIVTAGIHPFVGPATRFAMTALSGRDMVGRPAVKNPYDMASRLKGAAHDLNPLVASQLGLDNEGMFEYKGVGAQAAQAWGLTQGRFPTLDERTASKLGPNPTLPERMMAVKKAKDEMAQYPQNEGAMRTGGEKRLWMDFAKQDALKGALAPDKQDFLKTNNLVLRGFEDEITHKGMRLQLQGDEADKMQGVFANRYNQAIGILQSDPGFAKETHQRQQVRLDRVLTKAREVARKETRGVLSAPTGQP